MRGKWEERRQQTKGAGASIGRGSAVRRHHGTLAATALALAAEAAAALIADDADGGNSGVAIVGSASLAAGAG